MDKYKKDNHPNIRSFTQDGVYGKTLEYQLAFENEKNRLLLTPSLRNTPELKEIISAIEEEKSIEDLLEELKDSNENKRIMDSIRTITGDKWDDELKKKAVFASRYLNSVGKGENALELAVALKENLMNKGSAQYQEFNVPKYIREAIEWM